MLRQNGFTQNETIGMNKINHLFKNALDFQLCSNPTSSSGNTNTTVRVIKKPLTKSYSCADAENAISSTCECSFITPQEFCQLLKNKTQLDLSLMPIIDCRSSLDYANERIRHAQNLNCCHKFLAKRLSGCKRLEDVCCQFSSNIINSDFIIVYDQSTFVNNEEKLKAFPMNLCVQAAKKSQKKVFVILGGIDAVKKEYPNFIECAEKCPKPSLSSTHLTMNEECVPESPSVMSPHDLVMTEIVPHVFVGNSTDAQNRDRLNQHHITHIVNATPDIPCKWENDYRYLRVSILDLLSENIRQHFIPVSNFIDEAVRNNGNVLVHCSAGISRSPTLVLAYMINLLNMPFQEACCKMQSSRQIVAPNVSFLGQLLEFEKKIHSTTTAVDENNNVNQKYKSSSSDCNDNHKLETKSKTPIVTY
ncbi:unnamed protein product [Didymodactylos carnosus]|uniref:protein-tyrosine-phosphatase n=1 Tax=Didymodactylos carnosus TaxID=1234261 RepID=A0A814ASW8_9BILA|nr:unnamed protein product [Didymodactylos carnosus]CAF1074322.1 unnamed protein product [Didymodactylos carnosus]CAF3697098.1 unnamed protein product [Didymodactylos carnosus]CAF3838337.1 unnamed protein product [Didymodactylos carnosus]